jgi:hypothetical protein
MLDCGGAGADGADRLRGDAAVIWMIAGLQSSVPPQKWPNSSSGGSSSPKLFDEFYAAMVQPPQFGPNGKSYPVGSRDVGLSFNTSSGLSRGVW